MVEIFGVPMAGEFGNQECVVYFVLNTKPNKLGLVCLLENGTLILSKASGDVIAKTKLSSEGIQELQNATNLENQKAILNENISRLISSMDFLQMTDVPVFSKEK